MQKDELPTQPCVERPTHYVQYFRDGGSTAQKVDVTSVQLVGLDLTALSVQSRLYCRSKIHFN